MNLIYFLLYSISVIAVRFISTAIREDKLYAISKDDSNNSFHVTVYDLKSGLIGDVFSSGTTYSLTKLERGFDLKFFDVPDTLQEARNRLWLKSDQVSYGTGFNNSNSNFMGYINLSDMTFKADSSFIKFPTAENFPIFGYTMNTITNDLESALYVTGGVVYSKIKDEYISSNSFFKYNFATKEWKDMSLDVKGKLNPVYNHASVVVDNKTLVLIGGKVAKDSTRDSTLIISEDDLFKVNSIYKLTRFDTVTNSWESVALNVSLFDRSITTIQLTEFSANFYNNKVFLLGGLVTSNDKQNQDHNSKIGILDYKSNEWIWSPVVNDSGNFYSSPIEAKISLLFNDQVILTSGKPIEKDSDGFQIYSLTRLRMQHKLEFSKSVEDNSYQNDVQPMVPSYAIALITVGCVVLVILILFFIYFKYYRNKTRPQNHNTKPTKTMEAAWPNSEDPNMDYVTYDIKNNSENFNSDAKQSELKFESSMIEKPYDTQEYSTHSPGTTNTSTTL